SQRNEARALKTVRNKCSREVRIADPRPIERTMQRGSAADLLQIEVLRIVVVLIFHLAGVIRSESCFIAETRGPSRKCPHRTSSQKNRGLDVYYVSMLEAHYFSYLQIPVGVFEADSRGRIKSLGERITFRFALRRRNIQ